MMPTVVVRLAVALTAGLAIVGCGVPDAPVSAPRPAPAAPPDELPEPEQPATLDILSREPTEIRLDGKPIGKTPITGHVVTPGSHDVTFVFSETDAPTLNVIVAAGGAQTVKLDSPPPIRESGGNKDAATTKK